MIDFLYDRFDLEVSPTTISRTLKTERWSRKTNGRVAKQRNLDLREFYLYKLSDCLSYQLVFIDESGCDKRSGYRRRGWAPSGATPVQVDEFQRKQRFQILAAYTQRGVELARIYPGSTDAALFEDFIKQLLHHCGKWPEPKSVLVMDNASIHGSERLEQMCAEPGVRLLKLAPYSPDMNPVEELFAEIKTYIRQQRHNHSDLFEKDFKTFLKMCVDVVGSRVPVCRPLERLSLNVSLCYHPSFAYIYGR
jgi:transposase